MALPEEKGKGVDASKVALQLFYDVYQGGGALGGSFFTMALAKAKLDELKNYVRGYTTQRYNLGVTLGTLGKQDKLLEGYVAVLDDIEAWEKWLIDAWEAGLGMGLGGSFRGAIDQYLGTSRLVSMVKGSMYQIGVQPWLQRYFNTSYTPNLPDISTAFNMHMEGKLTRAEFNKYCSYEGWGTEWHDALYAVLDKDPDEYLAFSMYKRGLIPLDTLKRCFRIRGYDASWDTALLSALHRRPTFRELITLSDFVPLPDLWVTEVLRANGYLDGDIAYVLSAIRMRPLREEVRSVAGRYVWQYQIGRLNRDTLKQNLEKLGLLPTERDLWLLWADLRYSDELIDEQVEILELRYKNGDIATKEEAITELKNLGIVEEKANLMAEKWYWTYTPP